MHNYGWYLCQQKRYAESNAMFSQALAVPQYRGVARTLLAQGVCQAVRRPARRLGSLAVARLRARPEQPVHRDQSRRGALPARRIRAGALLHPPRQRQADVANAQTLWLAARIENKLGNAQGANDFGAQLRNRFPDSREASAFARGAFDE